MDRLKNFPVFVSIVDDEIDLLYMYKDALSQIPDIEVFAFSEPFLALEHFKNNHLNYQGIISDYRMPLMNGIELLDKVKKIKPGVTTMLISAFEIQDDVFKNRQCIDKFLQKPMAMKDLIEQVQTYINLPPIRIQELRPE